MDRRTEQLFVENLNRNRTRLFEFACRLTRNREDAEDLLQTAVAKAWVAGDRYDGSRSFKNWMMSIMKNAHRDQLRAASSRPQVTSADGWDSDLGLDDFADVEESTFDLILRRFLRGSLVAAVESLPWPYSEILQLFYLRELSYEECAKAAGIPAGTVRSRISRGRNLLRRVLATQPR